MEFCGNCGNHLISDNVVLSKPAKHGGRLKLPCRDLNTGSYRLIRASPSCDRQDSHACFASCPLKLKGFEIINVKHLNLSISADGFSTCSTIPKEKLALTLPYIAMLAWNVTEGPSCIALGVVAGFGNLLGDPRR